MDIKELEQRLTDLKKCHYSCDDRWYSCPKALDGCADPSAGPECTCGSEEHNALVDKLFYDLSAVFYGNTDRALRSRNPPDKSP